MRKEVLSVSPFSKLLQRKPALFLHHWEQGGPGDPRGDLIGHSDVDSSARYIYSVSEALQSTDQGKKKMAPSCVGRGTWWPPLSKASCVT